MKRLFGFFCIFYISTTSAGFAAQSGPDAVAVNSACAPDIQLAANAGIMDEKGKACAVGEAAGKGLWHCLKAWKDSPKNTNQPRLSANCRTAMNKFKLDKKSGAANP